MMDALVSKVNEYQDWRSHLVRVIGDYQNWLAASMQSDALQKRRLHDMVKTLKRDQLVVAFLAESSRGKTETINALFFPDFNYGLLPSEPDLNPMCPTEIFWDAREEPCIKLLPIVTRLSDDTLSILKIRPSAWTKFRLNINSPEEMKATLLRLIAQKEVTRNEAEKLGLFNPQDVSKVNALEKQSLLKIPIWRYATINYPHPLLKAGLVVLIPSLDTLTTEPEIMLNVTLSAHALLQQNDIQTLEAALGNQIGQAKQGILGRTVASECSVMMRYSRKLVQHRFLSLREQVLELRSIRDQNFDVIKPSLAKVVADRKRYEANMPTFTHASNKLIHLGKRLSRHLSVGYLDSVLTTSRQEMSNNWTLSGLNQAMHNLLQEANKLAANISKESRDIKTLADTIYHVFQTKHNFDGFEPPKLDISNFLTSMQALEKVTDDFCSDPANVKTGKYFLIRKLFLGLGVEIQKIFAQAEKDCSHWVEDVLSVLNTQMIEHKNSLDQRIKNLTEAKKNTAALDSQLALLEREYAALSKDSQALDSILLQLIKAAKPAVLANLTEKALVEFNQLMQLPESPPLNVTNL
jgi:hypothetical protein